MCKDIYIRERKYIPRPPGLFVVMLRQAWPYVPLRVCGGQSPCLTTKILAHARNMFPFAGIRLYRMAGGRLRFRDAFINKPRFDFVDLHSLPGQTGCVIPANENIFRACTVFLP